MLGDRQPTPATFLNDLNHDNFIRLMNEFVGSDVKGHFPAKELSTTATFAQPNTATLDDILGIVFSASSFTGAIGYSAIYHIFLPQGTDMCIDAQTCYSPDNFDTFVFCAFHFSVDFDADTHVLFTVEPYQFVPGCSIPGQTPHGVIDATASTVSHEQMETMMDPDGDAWFNGLTGRKDRTSVRRSAATSSSAITRTSSRRNTPTRSTAARRGAKSRFVA